MRQIIKQNHSIAWFSLYQFVTRGEREKALSIHKLLSRSINDIALILELEGDILFSFKENEEALEKYIHAGKIYSSQNKLSQAINVYEKIIAITNELIFLEKLLDLYIQNKNLKKIDSFLNKNLKLMLNKNNLELQKFLSRLEIINKNHYIKALSILENE
jgi:lipopolysaccharide biosynthesis regulator YciM